MKTVSDKTPRSFGFGTLESDAAAIRRFMKDLGWPEARLAEKANLSQQTINAFLNGKRKLSPAASDRVLEALHAGFEEKKRADELFEMAARELDPADPLFKLRLLSVPRDPANFEEWKAEQKAAQKQIAGLSASEELPAAKAWIAHLEKQRDEMKSELDSLREIEADQKEIAALYKAWVERLKKQLQDAGITPTD